LNNHLLFLPRRSFDKRGELFIDFQTKAKRPPTAAAVSPLSNATWLLVESRFCSNLKEHHCRADLGPSEYSVTSRTVSAAGFSGDHSGQRLWVA